MCTERNHETLEASTSRAFPLPPLELRERVGRTTGLSAAQERLIRRASWWDPDPAKAWLRQGRFLAGIVREQLPPDVDLRGARVLDFGCGAGRVLRHLVEDVGDGGLYGVDIDRPSIEWLQANASPPLHVARCDERPGLPYPDGHFDLVYVLSVFTHIVEDWAGWLLELRRVLAPGGVLLTTVIGRQTSAELRLAGPEREAPGMYARMLGNDWDAGGPVVVHDAVWVAERWGRAFSILSHARRVTGDPWPHDIVVARPKAGEVSEEELLAPGADGVAEGQAWAAQRELLRGDALERRSTHEEQVSAMLEAIAYSRAVLELRATACVAELSQGGAALEASAATIHESRGWRRISRAARAPARLRRTAPDGDAR